MAQWQSAGLDMEVPDMIPSSAKNNIKKIKVNSRTSSQSPIASLILKLIKISKQIFHCFQPNDYKSN